MSQREVSKGMAGQSEASEARIKALTDQLENGISQVFQSGQYAEYLSAMSKFHHYSFSNSMLIFMQRPDATCVAGYNDWKNKFGRHVKAHEHGIQILAPSTHRRWVRQEKLDPETNQPVCGADGEPVMEWVKVRTVKFRVVTVFDISQTEGKELPALGVTELSGDVAEYERMVSMLKALSPLPVVFEAFPGKAKGYCSHIENRIVVQPGMSQAQTIKTLIHEIAHAKLHPPPDILNTERPDRSAREVEAESVAYVVCQHFGIDTSDYSFAYVANWSRGKGVDVLRASMDRIHAAATELISCMEGQEKEQVRSTPSPRKQAGRPSKGKRQASPVR